ncbi:hypothetical protein KAU45_03955 [bacterium]|nr:hypothetical protein [bacterium]
MEKRADLKVRPYIIATREEGYMSSLSLWEEQSLTGLRVRAALFPLFLLGRSARHGFG